MHRNSDIAQQRSFWLLFDQRASFASRLGLLDMALNCTARQSRQVKTLMTALQTAIAQADKVARRNVKPRLRQLVASSCRREKRPTRFVAQDVLRWHVQNESMSLWGRGAPNFMCPPFINWALPFWLSRLSSSLDCQKVSWWQMSPLQATAAEAAKLAEVRVQSWRVWIVRTWIRTWRVKSPKSPKKSEKSPKWLRWGCWVQFDPLL